jgi:2-C-methyl-D-erythritol 4-phosphate cytidylyltransferase
MQGTDEAGLAARYGYTVRTVPGDPMNFKITRPEDFIVAEALVAKAAEAPA